MVWHFPRSNKQRFQLSSVDFRTFFSPTAPSDDKECPNALCKFDKWKPPERMKLHSKELKIFTGGPC